MNVGLFEGPRGAEITFRCELEILNLQERGVIIHFFQFLFFRKRSFGEFLHERNLI